MSIVLDRIKFLIGKPDGKLRHDELGYVYKVSSIDDWRDSIFHRLSERAQIAYTENNTMWDLWDNGKNRSSAILFDILPISKPVTKQEIIQSLRSHGAGFGATLDHDQKLALASRIEKDGIANE